MEKFEGRLSNGVRIAVRLYPDVTVLAGPNGSGKTLLLLALAEEARRSGISFTFWAEEPAVDISPEAITWAREKAEGPDIARVMAWVKEEGVPFSFGQKRLLGLISSLLRNKDVEIVLADLPEAGLHPGIQEELISWMREICPQSQFILATQSPALVMYDWFGQIIDMADIREAEEVRNVQS